MVIRQGDLFWVDLGQPSGSAPGYLRPYVVVQNDVYNQSRIQTVVICALTSNLMRSRLPGNVLLEEGEGNLPKRSVVNVSQLATVDKEDLGEKIGTLSEERMQQVLEGVHLLLEPREVS
jgi:mRNA interferase MazF